MEHIIILNFHTFNSKNIAKLLRNSDIYAEIKRGTTLASSVNTEKCKGVIMCGDYAGSLSGIDVDKSWFQLGLPVLALGSCALALNTLFGGKTSDVFFNDASEPIQYAEDIESPLKTQEVALIKGRALLPGDRMRCFAQIQNKYCIDIVHKEKSIYGFQHKFERNDPGSISLIQNFVLDICKCTPHWDYLEHLNGLIEEIRKEYSGRQIFSAISGGIDSAVATYIFKQALGDAVRCILIDTGLFRENEVENTLHIYQDILKVPVCYVDAKKEFFESIKDIEDMHQKDVVIHNKITEILERTLQSQGNNPLLVFGSNYNDTLFQSANDAQEYEEIKQFDYFCPLENLFKFEIRSLAEHFMLPDELIQQKSFHSAGLAINIQGKVTEERLQILRRAYSIFQSQIFSHGIVSKISRFNIRLCPQLSSSNFYQILLQAYPISQNPIVGSYRMPYDLLEEVSQQLMKEFPMVKQVLYDLSPCDNSNI